MNSSDGRIISLKSIDAEIYSISAFGSNYLIGGRSLNNLNWAVFNNDVLIKSCKSTV